MKNKTLLLIVLVIAVILAAVLISISINPKISETEALTLANEAVAEYGIAFDSVSRESAEQAKFVSEFIDDCDFSNYKNDEVWVAQKNLGEKEIGGNIQNVIVYVYVGLDGNVCKSAKLIDVIPGIIPIEQAI